MTKESNKELTITITEALAALRLTTKKIEKYTRNLHFIVKETATDITTGGTQGANSSRYQSVEKASDVLKAEYHRLQSLITYRAALKCAVVESNATTKVEIAGKSYSVAAAIEHKQLTINASLTMLEVMREAITARENSQARNQSDIERRVDSQLSTILQNQKNSGADTTLRDSIEKQIRASYEIKFHDPLEVYTRYALLEDEVQEFMNNVDTVLTISNSITKVTVRL